VRLAERADTERAVEESLVRTATGPDLSQAAMAMSPDTVTGFSLVESECERRSRAEHSRTGMSVRAVAGNLQVPPDGDSIRVRARALALPQLTWPHC
jgi:hypothetical protein